MPERNANQRAKMPVWMWTLLPMLLAGIMVVPVLGRDIFGGDQAATLRFSCARHLGPCTPAEAIQQTMIISPDQAWGLAIVISQWGQLVGWSEVAIRSLSWLAGFLTIAWVYRLGRDLFSPAIALTAALLLSGSVLFLVNMHVARLFGFAMLFTAFTLWGYWRLVLTDRPPDYGSRAALLLGATGVLYSHYYCALLVPALGLFHVLFVRKGRRWLQATVLLALATLLGLPQIHGVLGGIAFNEVKEGLHRRALEANEILILLFRSLSGDLLHVPDFIASILVLSLVPFLLWALWKGRRRHWRPDAGPYLMLVSVLLALLGLAVNERVKVFAPERIRYLASLWPPAMLLLGVVVDQLSRLSLRRLALVLVVVVVFAGATDFLWEGGLLRLTWRWRLDRATIPVVNRVRAEARPDRLLLVDPVTFGAINHSYEYYTGMWGDRRLPLYPDSLVSEVIDQAWKHEGVWLLYLSASEDRLHVPDLVNQLTREGWIEQLDWQDGRVTLKHLLSPPS